MTPLAELDWLPTEDTTPLNAGLAYQAHGFRPIPIYAPTPRGCSCRMGRSCSRLHVATRPLPHDL
jgi:hypothetical protein